MKAILAMSLALLCANALSADTRIWINEFNFIAGTSDSEFVEIVVNLNDNAPGFGGLNLNEIRVDLYDGTTGMSYANTTLNTLTETSDGRARYFIWNTSLQDGDPDGISLAIGSGASASQFISYDGSFIASDGPADGQTSFDVGFTDTAGDNMSVGLVGIGENLESFSWIAPMSATPGALNLGQSIPEPGSALLLLGGLAAWGMSQRRRPGR